MFPPFTSKVPPTTHVTSTTTYKPTQHHPLFNPVNPKFPHQDPDGTTPTAKKSPQPTSCWMRNLLARQPAKWRSASQTALRCPARRNLLSLVSGVKIGGVRALRQGMGGAAVVPSCVSPESPGRRLCAGDPDCSIRWGAVWSGRPIHSRLRSPPDRNQRRTEAGIVQKVPPARRG